MLAFLREGLEKNQVGFTCLQPHRKVWGQGAPSQGLRTSQVYGQVYHRVPGGLRHREDQTSTSLTSLPALKSGVRLSFPWKTMGSLLSLTKQRRKHLQKTNLEGLQSCLLKTSRARDISKSHGSALLEVQGISEVCLNTNRILGQRPVRGMVHRLRELETD